MAIGKEGNVKWVDGLRGIASSLVVVKHVTIAWFPYIMWPSPGPEDLPVLLERPYLRVFFQGRIGVAIFSFVTGYVCCLKPIKLFHQGNHDKAFAAIAKSAIRRVPRLVLPVAIVLVLSCLATQLGVFEVARHSDGWGLDVTSPEYFPNWLDAFWALVCDEVRVWTFGQSMYGAELWTMMPILKGAFWVYVYLLATAYVQQRYRMMIALFLAMFRYCANDPFFGMQFFFGAFMADLQNPIAEGPPVVAFLAPHKSHMKWLRMFGSVAFLALGFFIASLPDDHYDYQAWSQGLYEFLRAILPRDPDFPRFSSGLGLDLIVIGLHFSTTSRNILSSKPFIWLGRMSFAVYLLHNQILRSVLCWMVYGFSLPEQPTDFPGAGRLFTVLPIYWVLVYGAAWLWTTYVDAWCAKVTEKLVGKIKEDDGREKSEPLLPLAAPVRANEEVPAAR
ncbi:hypothetical protein M406DRAFT_348329 [Cryphonectria parasitica EP155]|uniref:Acyltransferase 3 domain-containing protein n=1 Tax=Cryphonectria parasitica (strain ATCC 38755 / EP155) TaxID=660469 RepID=A0A9P4XTU0_CRYP1|nr:uncharacterized protein M406DRAFT_348329 [Cryphonectria parasitica EP155]KAF3760904.1 hypothetical protein M406DRAFT_348329 [Cryphonectria parasitica EP155]